MNSQLQFSYTDSMSWISNYLYIFFQAIIFLNFLVCIFLTRAIRNVVLSFKPILRKFFLKIMMLIMILIMILLMIMDNNNDIDDDIVNDNG